MMQAFNDLLEEKKNIYSISVFDIAARATVNRATFYAHFEDKFAFLEQWMTEKSKAIIGKRVPEDAEFNEDTMRILVQTLFDFLVRFRQYLTPGDKQFEPMFEIAMQKELHRLLLRWLGEGTVPGHSREQAEATALVVSWGIFGSALQGSRDSQNRSAETMTRAVMEVVRVNLAPFWGRQPG